MKKMKLLPSAVLVANLMLCAVYCQAQRQKDTISVVMVIADTIHYTNYTPKINKKNYFDKAGELFWVSGYSVREKHNTDEGQIDPYISGDYVSQDSWVHILYLDGNKKPLSKNIVVWQSVSK